MSAATEKFGARARRLTATVAIVAAAAASAQTSAPNSANPLRLPENPQVFGSAMPSVVKATAIVNGEVITQTDVDQRLALLAVANGGRLPAGEAEQLRQQVLRNLIDETLQIQAAKASEISIRDPDIDRMVQRVADNLKQSPSQLTSLLQGNGSSIRSIRRQIEGELAWNRLLSANVESTVSVGDEEVKAILARMNASKGTEEFRVGEIYLSAAGGNQEQAQATATRILEQLRNGASFTGYARQYSEASTAAVGGDLGWVRPEQLPDPIATVLRQMEAGSISTPIPVSGGVSIIAVQDKRRILTADPRSAVLGLKQVSIAFPKGTTRPQAEPVIARFAAAAQNVGGCGGADRIAAEFNGEVVQSDQVQIRELPSALQEMMLPMQVGQSTPPFGSLEEGVRILVLCGRDEPKTSTPTFDTVFSQINEERVNLRARRYLRDLRRDAVIEFR
ncbi:MAG: peptidylprolyl isomerase [Pseudomonadota bacterium]|nr:peptidylprolyl isomerase [Pseudomonadota bacterium]